MSEDSASSSSSDDDQGGSSGMEPRKTQMNKSTPPDTESSTTEREDSTNTATEGSSETPTQQSDTVSDKTAEVSSTEISRPSTESASQSERRDEASTRTVMSPPASMQDASGEPDLKTTSDIDVPQPFPGVPSFEGRTGTMPSKKGAPEEVARLDKLDIPAKTDERRKDLQLGEPVPDDARFVEIKKVGEEVEVAGVPNDEKKPLVVSISPHRKVSMNHTTMKSEELINDEKAKMKVHWLERTLQSQDTLTTINLDGEQLDSFISTWNIEPLPDAPCNQKRTSTEDNDMNGHASVRTEVEFAEQAKGLTVTLLDRARLFYPVVIPKELQKELLLYPLAVLLLIVLFLVMALIQSPPKPKVSVTKNKRGLTELCQSETCVRHAHYLANLLSWSVNPCDNFYKFVCHRLVHQSPISGDKPVVSSDDDAVSELEDNLYARLQQTQNVPPPLKNFFDRCVTELAINYNDLDRLLELVFQVSLEGFPLTPPVRNSKSVWKIAAKILRKTGAATLFSVDIALQPDNPKTEVAALGLPDHPLGTEGMGISEAVAVFNETTFAIFKALNKEFVPLVYKEDIVRFARRVFKIYRPTASDSDFKAYQIRPRSPIHTFLGEVFAGVKNPVYGGAESDVMVESAQYVSKLVELVNKTRTHTVMNYLGVRLIMQTVMFLPRTELLGVSNSLYHGKFWPPIHGVKFCLHTLDKVMPQLFQVFAMADYSQALSKIANFVSRFPREFLRRVQSQTFLNNASRLSIQRLVEGTRFQTVGHFGPREKKLFDEYSRHHPTLSNVSTALESYVAAHEYNFDSFLARRSTTRWPHSVFSASCSYERLRRTIHIPALLFNRTLLSDSNLEVLGLSEAAARIGRCIFDMAFLETGSSDVSDEWLSEATRSSLFPNCFGGGRDVPWMSTLGDAWTTSIAYDVSQLVFEGAETALSLKVAARTFDSRQLFFVYLMLRRCGKKKGGREGEPFPVFSRPWNMVLRNVRGFGESYLCSPGSPMSPDSDCGI